MVFRRLLRLFGEEPAPEIEALPEPPPPAAKPPALSELDDRQPFLEASGFYSSTIMELHKLDGTIEDRYHHNFSPLTKARYPRIVGIQISDIAPIFGWHSGKDSAWHGRHMNYAQSMDYNYFIPSADKLIPGRPLFYKYENGCKVIYQFENGYIASICGNLRYWGDASPETFDCDDIGHKLERVDKNHPSYKYLNSKKAYRYMKGKESEAVGYNGPEYAPTYVPSRPPSSIAGDYVYKGTRCETHPSDDRPQMRRRITTEAAAARYRDALVIHNVSEAHHFAHRFDYKIDIDGCYVAGELIYVSDVRKYCLVIFPGNYIARFSWAPDGYFCYEGDADQQDFPPDLFPSEDDD